MQRGAEVKVGLIALLALALLAFFVFVVAGYRFTSHTYKVCATFDSAQGIQRGDPVMLAGVRIGEVSAVTVDKDLKAQLILAIEKAYPLYDSYRFQIASSGLIQQLSIEVLPPEPGAPQGERLKPNQCIRGTTSPTISDLLKVGTQVLTNLNEISGMLRTDLSDQQMIGKLKEGLRNLADAADSASKLMRMAGLTVGEARPELLTAVSNIRAASADVKATTGAIRTQVADSNVLRNLDAMSESARRAADKLDRITDDVSQITTNPKVKEDILCTLEDVRTTAESVKRSASDVEVFAAELRKAAPAVPETVNKVSDLGGTVKGLKEALKPPKIDASFNVLYSPNSSRSYSSGNLDFYFQPSRFLRLGVEDIGENTQLDAQVGEVGRGCRILRYGLYRSQLGIGLDTPLPRGNELTLNLFDPNHLKLDGYVAFPASSARRLTCSSGCGI